MLVSSLWVRFFSSLVSGPPYSSGAGNKAVKCFICLANHSPSLSPGFPVSTCCQFGQSFSVNKCITLNLFFWINLLMIILKIMFNLGNLAPKSCYNNLHYVTVACFTKEEERIRKRLLNRKANLYVQIHPLLYFSQCKKPTWYMDV